MGTGLTGDSINFVNVTHDTMSSSARMLGDMGMRMDGGGSKTRSMQKMLEKKTGINPKQQKSMRPRNSCVVKIHWPPFS